MSKASNGFRVAAAAFLLLVNAAIARGGTCTGTPPTLLQPANNATVALPVTFAWSALSGVNGYSVYAIGGVSTIPVLLGSTSTTTKLTVSALPNGPIQWFVRALYENCPAASSSRFTVNISTAASCPTGTAGLRSPADNSTNLPNPVTFDWDDVPGAASYRVFISVNDTDPAPIARVAESRLTTPVPAGTVKWYVETQFENCPSTQSPTFHFTTAPSCPDASVPPQTIAPSDGATSVASPVSFQWTAVAGATAYRVWATRNGDSPVLLGTTQSTQLSAPLPAGKFAWAVVAIFGEDCPTVVSKYAVFTVTTAAPCNGSPPTLIAPANAATGVNEPVDFHWSAVSGAVSYQLFMAVNGGQFDMLATTPDTTVTRIVPAGAISWYVIAQFPGCPDQRSATLTFTPAAAATCGTQTMTLTAPASGSSQKSPVTFSWSSVPGATSYRLWVGIDGNPPGVAVKPTTPSASVVLPSGKVEWYVEAIFANCPSSVSNHGQFTVEKNTTCTMVSAPALISPAGTSAQPASTSTSVTFKWNAAAGVPAYIVWIAAEGQPYADIAVTKQTTASRDLPAGKFSWFVETLFEGCPSVRSDTAYFVASSSTPRCSGDAPSLLQPADGAKSQSPVTFLWSSVTGAEAYRLFASLEENGDSPVLIGVTPETSLTVPLPPGTIKWYVETIFPTCNSTRSAPSKLMIPKAANCTDQPAQLVAPATGSTVTKMPVDFSWNAVSGAAAYVLIVKAGDGAPTPVAETTDTHYTRHVPEGPIEWWVVTFVAGCGANDSQHFTFNVPATDCVKLRPMAFAPPDGAELLSPAAFEWTPVPKAKEYKVWSVATDGASLLVTTSKTEALVSLPSGTIEWFVEATFDTCPSTRSPLSRLKVFKGAPACRQPEKPDVKVAGQVVSGATYRVRWTVIPNSDHYELQESTSAAFTNAATQVLNGVSASFSHTVTDKPTRYFYRVRAISSCSDDRGAYSDVAAVFVVPQLAATQQSHVAGEFGAQGTITQTRFIPGGPAPVAFTAKADKPWLTVTPSSGTIPASGLTLTLSADPSALPLGTNTATVQLSYPPGKNGTGFGTTSTTVPVSVSLVTPVSPTGKNTPLPESLIIPAVAHSGGLNDSMFESDVRVTNTSAQAMKYQLNFTPSGKDGTLNGSSTTIQVDPGTSMALDDILSSFFGTGTDGSSAIGTLEIRPLTSTSTSTALSSTATTSAGVQLTTVASSRTFNVTSNGTFGQYIPAVPYSQFIGKSTTGTPAILTLQQIAQSSSYRTNFGLVEGSGENADVLLTVFDNTGAKIAEIPQSLLPGEHLQINQLLAVNNIPLEDGRIEVTVTSATGRVTAYASTLDNRTNDPLLVSPVLKGLVSSTRYIVPGIADLNTGIAAWRSDVRIFNSGLTAVTTTLTYSPQAGYPAASKPATVTINAGETKAIDNILQDLFGLTNSGGSLIITTTAATSLVVTARTYNQTSNGTYGQFIPGVTPSEAAGTGGRALQLLQLEQSSRMRTNIGLAETTGNAATVEVALILPDSASTAKTSISLAANEFHQFSLADFGVTNAYNARVTVKVTAGTGKVTAYGSVIDQVTQDPTYVPAQ